MLDKLTIQTNTLNEMLDITAQVQELVTRSGVADGTIYLYCPHTTCGLTIQENCDPGVQQDMLLLLNRLAPREDSGYRHIEDNSASHLQTSLMGISQLLFIEQGRLVLGRWQGIYLCEFDGPRPRNLLAKIEQDVWRERTTS